MLFNDYKIVLIIILIAVSSVYGVERRVHFLEYGPGAAASGMGNAYTAGGDDASVIYYNSSLLANLFDDQLTVSHWFMYDGAKYNFISYSSSWENQALAFAGMGLSRGNIELYDENGTLSPVLAESSQLAAYIAYARYLENINANYGITFKYISYKMNEITGMGLGLDFGASKALYMRDNFRGRKFSVNSGIQLQNFLQMPVKMISEEEVLPAIGRFGLSCKTTMMVRYNRKLDRYDYNEMAIAADGIYSGGNISYGGGVEYAVNGLVFFRAGYNEGPTAGFGLKFLDFKLDYSYIPKDFFEIHKMGFSIRFGQNEM